MAGSCVFKRSWTHCDVFPNTSSSFCSSPASSVWLRSASVWRDSVSKPRILAASQPDNLASFSSSLGTDLPLHEFAQVPFQDYLQNRQRVFEALFPDKQRSERLNDDEWRIYMLPLEFLFLSVSPVVDMRIVVRLPESFLATEFSKDVEKILTLEATKWDMRGLDYVLKPSDFTLNINGLLFSERRHGSPRLKGNLKLSVEFAVPPAWMIIPRDVLKTAGEALLTRLLESMKKRVNSRLLDDYRAYARELLINSQDRTRTVSPAA